MAMIYSTAPQRSIDQHSTSTSISVRAHLTHSLTHSLTQTTPSLTHSRTHSLTHSLVPAIQVLGVTRETVNEELVVAGRLLHTHTHTHTHTHHRFGLCFQRESTTHTHHSSGHRSVHPSTASLRDQPTSPPPHHGVPQQLQSDLHGHNLALLQRTPARVSNTDSTARPPRHNRPHNAVPSPPLNTHL